MDTDAASAIIETLDSVRTLFLLFWAVVFCIWISTTGRKG